MGRRSKRPDAIPRLRMRRQKSGKVHYYYDLGGKPRREEPLGSDYGIAIQKWAEYERSRSAADKVREVLTFRYVAEQYRIHVIPTKSPLTQVGNLKELANLLAFFDDPPGPLEAIKPVNVRQYLTWRAEPRVRLTKKGKPVKSTGNGLVRAKREKALLSHIWNFARDRGYTSLANPCLGIKGQKEKSRSVYVDDDELKLVWDNADQSLRDALDLAYLTGQRPQDTLAMDIRDVRDNTLFVRQLKTDELVPINVTGEFAKLLERIRERKKGMTVVSTRLVIDQRGQPLTKGQLRYRFDKARLAAGVTFQFRDLRAKAATDKADSTGDVRKAQHQLGHTSVTTTERYLRRRRGIKVEPTK
jgi:integrase